ncbi:MAG: type II toxin-antitoxin system HipA family toxin [Nocardioidaceae bacterium]
MSRELAVFLYGHLIGYVAQSPAGAHSFRYDDAYLATSAPTPLSLSMPLARSTYTRKNIEPWLSGLLPDSGEVRERWGARFGVSGENPFALLEQVGLDCAGAVQFIRVDEAKDNEVTLPRAGRLVEVSEAEIGDRLMRLGSDPAAWAVSGERWSLAGAQAKFALARGRDGRWYEPSGSAASTHILKPGLQHYRDQALNEHVCLQSARALGLNAVRTDYLEFDGQRALVVTRYDRRRRRGSDAVIRVHQEDMCQALSVYPRRKYESSKGPTSAQIARLLRSRSSRGQDDVEAFVRAVAFNYLIGAPDAHAKNYSVRLAGSDVELAPLYDVASAFPYEPTRTDHELDEAAMSIGGQRRFGSVSGRHWDRWASACGVDAEAVRSMVGQLCAELPDAVASAFGSHAASHAELRSRLVDAVASHTHRTATGLRRSLTKSWSAPAHRRSRLTR